MNNMDLKQKIVNLIGAIENILENNKGIYTKNTMEQDFRKNYWNYALYLDGEEVSRWPWYKETVEAVQLFVADRIKDNRDSCGMKKKDNIEKGMQVYDILELGKLSAKARNLYELYCKLEEIEESEVLIVQKIEDGEKAYYFLPVKN